MMNLVWICAPDGVWHAGSRGYDLHLVPLNGERWSWIVEAGGIAVRDGVARSKLAAQMAAAVAVPSCGEHRDRQPANPGGTP